MKHLYYIVALSLQLWTVSYASTGNFIPANSNIVIKSKHSSNILDLTHLHTDTLSFALRNPETHTLSYTQDPIFLKKNGYFYQGKNRLQGYKVPEELSSSSCELVDVQVSEQEIPGKPTSHISLDFNLNANATWPVTEPFNIHNSGSYNDVFSFNIYDKAEKTHYLSMYFAKPEWSTWKVYVIADNESLVGEGQLSFHSDGTLDEVTLYQVSINFSEQDSQIIKFDFTHSTQFGSPFLINAVNVNGYPSGDVVEERVSNNGYLSQYYTNGISRIFSKIAVFSDQKF